MLSFLKEDNGQYSFRRGIALLSFIAGAVLAILALKYDGWYVYIPCGLFIATTIIMTFFTTATDIVDAIAKIKGK